jgi:hypothetical protein
MQEWPQVAAAVGQVVQMRFEQQPFLAGQQEEMKAMEAAFTAWALMGPETN